MPPAGGVESEFCREGPSQSPRAAVGVGRPRLARRPGPSVRGDPRGLNPSPQALGGLLLPDVCVVRLVDVWGLFPFPAAASSNESLLSPHALARRRLLSRGARERPAGPYGLPLGPLRSSLCSLRDDPPREMGPGSAWFVGSNVCAVGPVPFRRLRATEPTPLQHTDTVHGRRKPDPDKRHTGTCSLNWRDPEAEGGGPPISDY